MLKALMYVWIGGGLGSILRYGIYLVMNKFFPVLFPWGTFLVNILGCFAIGAFFAIAQQADWNTSWKLFLITGLCGGFTTFSSFSNEGIQLLQQGHYINLALYVLLSVALGLLATYLGLVLFRG